MKQDSEKFDASYARLNAGQKKAVDTIEGPVMVMAGPGTGKTQVLTLRIANILKQTDTPPDAILALTYTNAGVTAMRERLKSFIGHDAYRVHLHTFHNYATSVIESHPTAFPRIIGASSADDVDTHDIVRTAIEEVGGDALRPSGDPEYYVKHIIGLISALKNDRVGVNEYDAYIKSIAEEDATEDGEPSKKLVRSAAFVEVFKKYEALMRERNLFDYSDMLIELIVALEENNDLRLELAESAQYILADEHQDANRSQNRILELLASAHIDGETSPNLFIVGDDKQAIYRFQGASLENFLYFKEKFSRATVIPLVENYRSTEEILESAGLLMVGRALANDTLISKRGKGEKIEVITAPDSDAEVDAVTTRISELIKGGTKPDEIAVLLRQNRDIDVFVRSLKSKNIPFISLRDSDALATAEITLLIALIRASVNPSDSSALGKALFLSAFAIPTSILATLFSESKRRRVPLQSLIEETKETKRASDFFKNIMKQAHTAHAMETLDTIVTVSGYLNELMNARELSLALSAYRSVRTLIETRSGRNERYTLKDAVALLSDLERGIASVPLATSATGSGVRVMTLHKSKGLEFEHVFLPHALESRFKPRADRELFYTPPEVNKSEGDIEDERKLFYVGVTRAKVCAYISQHEKRDDEKEEKPLAFIVDLGAVRETKVEKKDLLTLPPSIRHTTEEARKEYTELIDAFLLSGISATALNAYLNDPWECFFSTILRLPETKAPHQMYGTAIHYALEHLYAGLKKGEPQSVDTLISYFIAGLSREKLSAHDRRVFAEKGKSALATYFEAKKETLNPNAETEVVFSVDIALPPHHERESVHIRGKLDHIEVEHGNEAHVTDYKTGKVKSRNDILGKTQAGDGSIHRQLIFYKILLDTDGRYQFKDGLVDFIEPNPSGKHKEELFIITEEEKTTLIEQIGIMVNDLVRGDFLQKTCASEDAQVRGLSEIIRARYLR